MLNAKNIISPAFNSFTKSEKFKKTLKNSLKQGVNAPVIAWIIHCISKNWNNINIPNSYISCIELKLNWQPFFYHKKMGNYIYKLAW
jgi:hypothetical protein